MGRRAPVQLRVAEALLLHQASSSGSDSSSPTASSQACSSARASAGPRSPPSTPRGRRPRSSPAAIMAARCGLAVAGVAAAEARASPAPSRRAPTSRRALRAARAPRRGGRCRNCSGVEGGVSVHVRPMSTPAWSSEPPPGAAVGLDVDGGGGSAPRARAVAASPRREELGQSAAVARPRAARRPRRRGARARTRSRSRAGTRRTARRSRCAGARRGPPADAPAEHVHGLRLALERGGQLLGHEHVGAVRDLEPAVDRVVVGWIVTKSIPRAWPARRPPGGVAHSGRSSVRCTPKRGLGRGGVAVEVCARVIWAWHRFACKQSHPLSREPRVTGLQQAIATGGGL